MKQLRRALPSLSSLTAFEAASRLLSFSAAARELNVTQAAVSRQIRELETDLRTSLFVRGHRKVELTRAGSTLAYAVAPAFERIADAVELVRQPEVTAGLTISTSLALSHFWLLPRLPGFREAHPDVKLRVWSGDAPSDLREGGVDVCLRFGKRPFADGDILASVDDAAFPVCSPDFRDRLGRDVTLRILANLPLIDTDITDPNWLTWRRWFALAGLERPRNLSTLQFSNYSDAVYAAMGGQGVVLGWERLLERPLNDGRLEAIGEPYSTGDLAYHVVVPKGRVIGPTVQAFADWVSESFKRPFAYDTGRSEGPPRERD